jgi:uncharacterized protein YxjI
MDLSRGGTKIATIRKARFAPFRDRFSIDVVGAEDMIAQGDILHHEYDIRRRGETVARVSKHRFALSDTYGIEVTPGEDEGLVLAVAVAVDEMAHNSDGGDH